MNTLTKEVMGDIGECIYCGSKANLSEEHILPYALNGKWTLLNASCPKCAAITSRFELDVTRNLLASTRAFHQFQTRRKKQQPKKFLVKVDTKTQKNIDLWLPIEEYGAVTVFPKFELPGHITGNHLPKGIAYSGHNLNRNGGMSLKDLEKKYSLKTIAFLTGFRPTHFALLMAKVAYGFAVGHYGIKKMRSSFVLPSLRNDKDEIGEWVGVSPQPLEVADDVGIEIFEEGGEIRARVQLFAKLNGSIPYLVILGKI